MKINCSPKLVIIQAVLQTLNANFRIHKQVTQFIVIKVLCFSTMSMISVASYMQAFGVILQKYNHPKPPDTDDFLHGGRNS